MNRGDGSVNKEHQSKEENPNKRVDKYRTEISILQCRAVT